MQHHHTWINAWINAWKKWFRRFRYVFLGICAGLIALVGCLSPSWGQPAACAPLVSLRQPSNATVLQESWTAYRDRFIQGDGRVIDWESDQRSTSEGQAYALLRAALIDDRDTFNRSLNWSENNLARRNDKGERTDQLWAWKWGKTSSGEWKTIDANFASDADIDAATALILAARRWNQPDYLELARRKLTDLWNLSVATAPNGNRYLMPGPAQVFWRTPDSLTYNPSYFAPYAFRLFAQVDRQHDWMALVKTGYAALEKSTAVSTVGLPSDWISLNPMTGMFQALPSSSDLQSRYGFDAYRVWWRIALDASWFGERQATQYLRQHLTHLQQLWRSQKQLPAQIDLQGRSIVNYEATAQYATLYPALQLIDQTTADQIYQQKLMPTYKNGFWDNNSAYYTQNLAWFALLPPNPPAQVRS